ncbi:MAG: nucleotide exchange factor GrpE [Treponema sp.]|jgi:molecular chaperone GrpE|nr:nucleotide exchange factor GrpE [Treponema sp.]
MSKHQTRHGQDEQIASEQGQTNTEETGQAANAAESGPHDNVDSVNEAESAQKQEEKAAVQPAEPTPEEKIAELETQLAETRDQLLRKAADFENFRKRMNQEKQSAIDYANQSLLLDIIPIIDDFERAIQSAEASAELAELPAGKVMLDGITMIEKRLSGQLESKWGLKRFNSVGEPFDPNKHEALMMEKSADVTEAVVQEDLIKGYFLKDRVLRAAKVKVLMPEDSG